MQKTFIEALRQWLSARCLNKKKRTCEFYSDVHRIIFCAWHEPQIEVSKITEEDVLFFANSVAHHCPSRWNTIVSAFRSITPHGKVLKRKPLRVRQFNPPNQAQFVSFLAECDGTNYGPKSNARLVVNFLCLTGLRITEARNIRWKNVFADRIEVPAEFTKSGKMRSVPLLFGIDAVLKRLKAISDGEFVLPRENPRKAIESACVRAGVPKMSFHCFRHYFATRCIESGVDMQTVAVWLGHQDRGVTLAKHYFHLANEHSRAMAAKVKIAA